MNFFKRRSSRPQQRTDPHLQPAPPPPPPPHIDQPPPPPPAAPHSSHDDLYHSLGSFTFGAPPAPHHHHPQPLDPLADDDDSPYRADTTPRPSLATPTAHPSHPSQLPAQHHHPTSTSTNPTSSNPSASNSVSSIPSTTASTSTSTSHSHSHSRRPRSSAGSSDCNDDRRHHSFHLSDHDGSAASEEEFDDDSDAPHEIEVSSIAHPGSDKGSFRDFASVRSASIRGTSYSDRRSHLVMPIPGTPSDRSFVDSRNREDSLATLRRPSRSLEEIRPFNPNASHHDSASSRDRPLPVEPTSMPGSETDWRGVRKRSIQRDTDSPVSMHTSRTSSAPAAVEGLAPASADEFDLAEFSRFAARINSIDSNEMRDIVKDMPVPRRSIVSALSTKDRRRSSTQSDAFVRSWDVKDWSWIFRLEKPETSNRNQNWRGMALNSEELWVNKMIGRFNVTRKNMPNPRDKAKSPQQRINVRHTYSPPDRRHLESPPTTIHKHSKSIAFSISRHHKSSKSKTMIMLAQPIVQAKSTNTSTTRKLESHGLLDDVSRDSHRRSRHREDASTSARPESRASTKQKSRKVKKSSQDDPDSQVSSRGSLAASATLVSGSPPDPSSISVSRPGSSCNSENYSVTSHETHSTAVCAQPSPSPSPSTPSTVRQEVREDDLDLWDDERRQPVRTPHSEAYSTMSPEMLDSLTNKSESRRFIYRSNKIKSNGNQNHLLAQFNPPWLLPASRHQTEARNGIVTDLNQSFQDVGLLPVPTDSSRNGQHRHRHGHSKESSQQKALANVMELEDAYYMLLPLWPEDTDPESRKHFPLQIPPALPEERRYLLVFYKAQLGSTRDEGKKGSPTSSWDSLKDDRTPLLSTFNVSGRIVTYQELQGTGVRISDSGLAVVGPLQEAYRSMPSFKSADTRFNKDYVMIAYSHSSRGEIQFVPHGWAKLGLCYERDPPPSASQQFLQETGDMPEPVLEPTPIGRAVLEMVWAGCLALTSFGSG